MSNAHARHEGAEAAVAALLSAFPPEFCHESVSEASAAAQLRTPIFCDVPRLARAAANRLAAADACELSASLGLLYDELRTRAASPGLLMSPVVGPSQLGLLRALFMCVVLLLEAALLMNLAYDTADVRDPNAGCDITVDDAAAVVPHRADARAADALCALALIPVGAVAMPQLDALEDYLLAALALSGRLATAIREYVEWGTARPGGGGDARCALALRWAAAALAQPQLAPQLWPQLASLLDASLGLRVAGGVSEVTALGGACASVLQSALGGLAVDVPEQHAVACQLLEHLASQCEQQPWTPHLGGDPVEGRDARRPEAAQALLFSLLPAINEPLLPLLLQSAQRLLHALLPHSAGASAQTALATRCALRLRQAISASPPGPRKQQLLDWLHELRYRMLEQPQLSTQTPSGQSRIS